MDRKTRKKLMLRRRIFICCCACVLVAAILLVVFVANVLSSKPSSGEKGDTSNSELHYSAESDKQDDSLSESSEPEIVPEGAEGLDAKFSILLLVNPWNPLPEDYNIEENLVEVDKSLRNNDYVYRLHKDIYPYVKAMVEAAHKDGVDLRVWSPYRSYAVQKDLFKNKVERVKKANPSLTQAEAEAEAATVVARPGTSEHQTGLAADFNCANNSFDNSDYYKWMKENAEDYGFIQRFTAEKQEKTGIIPESWHWRFVGISTAKEMNRLNMCLEEYLEYKGIDFNRE